MSGAVLVTGASRGIGRAIAERFRASGREVLAPARSEMDLASAESVAAYLASIAGRDIEVLVNDAGENRVGPIASYALEDWNRILAVNLTAAFLLTRGLAPQMARAGSGRIVNVSSCFSFLARAGRAAYAASKAGLNGLTRTAALEYAGSGVLVNAVCPGFIETDMTHLNNGPAQIRELEARIALGRLGRPEEVAELVFFLASEENSYITGQTVVIDGGFSVE